MAKDRLYIANYYMVNSEGSLAVLMLSLSPFDGRSESDTLPRVSQIVLCHHPAQPVKRVTNAAVCPFEAVKYSMYTLCSLFRVEPRSYPLSANPWHHVFLQRVHFWRYSGIGELSPIKLVESSDVSFCELKVINMKSRLTGQLGGYHEHMMYVYMHLIPVVLYTHLAQ